MACAYSLINCFMSSHSLFSGGLALSIQEVTFGVLGFTSVLVSVLVRVSFVSVPLSECPLSECPIVRVSFVVDAMLS